MGYYAYLCRLVARYKAYAAGGKYVTAHGPGGGILKIPHTPSSPGTPTGRGSGHVPSGPVAFETEQTVE